MTEQNNLLSKIENRTAQVAITSPRLSTSIGLGDVGLAFAEAGFSVPEAQDPV